MKFDQIKIVAIVGLGYVGLPLAVEFAKQYKTIGFDIQTRRIDELKAGLDSTREVSSEELGEAELLELTNHISALKEADVIIVTVPTPIDYSNQPDLTPLRTASTAIAQVMKTNCIVVYESTVYPGVTEEVCVPILEAESGKVFNRDFYVGYSPERINPGDTTRRLPDILKVTSGSTPAIATTVDELYRSIIVAGTHKASSIRVAEASKVIENTQRDLNIALVNELSVIFSRLGIDTLEVLEAAGTKWNFMPFRPGLVGGHCIGVDPYYLTHKAQQVGYHPEVILAGRRINDSMGRFVVTELVRTMIKRKLAVTGGKVLVLGFTFKENCPDLRNSRVIDIVNELKEYDIHVDVADPELNTDQAFEEYGIHVNTSIEPNGAYDAVIMAVAHRQLVEMGGEAIRKYLNSDKGVLFDLKGVLERRFVDIRL